MKKILYILIALFILAGVGIAVLAQNNETTNVGTLPDSPFYFIKGWQEGIQTFLTSGAENKAKQYLQLADIRFAEYQKMVEKGKDKIAQTTLNKYQKQIGQAIEQVNKLNNQKKDTTSIYQQINNSVVKNIVILEANLQRASDSAKQGIQNIIDALKQMLGISANDTNTNQNTNTNTSASTNNNTNTNTNSQNNNSNNSTNKSTARLPMRVGASMTYEEAVAIAERDCGYPVKEQHSCNSGTGTWWLDLNVNKPGCNPACVVNITKKIGAINWRCTGLIVPSN